MPDVLDAWGGFVGPDSWYEAEDALRDAELLRLAGEGDEFALRRIAELAAMGHVVSAPEPPPA